MTYARLLARHRRTIIILKHLDFTCSDIHFLITKYYFTNVSYKGIVRYVSTFTYAEHILDLSKDELSQILKTHKYLVSNRRATYHKKSKLFKYKTAILRKYSISKNIKKIWHWLRTVVKINVAYSTVRRFILKSGAPHLKKTSVFHKHINILKNKFAQLKNYTETHNWFLEQTGLEISYSTVRRLINKA